MNSVLITGANTGLGKEAAHLFVQRPDIERVVITARDLSRGNQALDDLRQRSNGTTDFSLRELDTTRRTSVEKLANEIDAVDIAILNAGGVAGKTAMEPSEYGVTNMMASNVSGHVDLVERLIDAAKIRERVIIVSSEAARGIKAMRIKPPSVDSHDRAAVIAAMRGEGDHANMDLLDMYAQVKQFGSFWAGAAARRHPHLVIASVSPGSTRGTEAANHMPFPMNKAMPLMMKLVMPLFGASHALTVGAQRYVDVATRTDIASGGFYASPGGKISGPLVDQRTEYRYLGSEAAQDTVLEAIRSLAKTA